MSDTLKKLAPLVRQVNEVMAELIARDEEAASRIGSYSFEGGGKRLRPLLFCLLTEALGEELSRKKLEMASAFEFLHMATLIHDDIVDLAETRRGRTAAHLVFGVPEAVLGGDYLLAKSSLLGADTANMECITIMAGIVSALSLGELTQLSCRRQVELPESDYFKIIYRKTAILMEGAVKCAAVLAGASQELIKASAAFGQAFGLAFQIIDDILDYQGDEAAFGKPVGHDLEEGKITLPFIRAREAAVGDARGRLCELAGRNPLERAEREEVIRMVIASGGVESARLKAEELSREAVKALDVFPPSAAKEILRSLAAEAVSRNF